MLALWCRHRDGEGEETRSDGLTIRYGRGFAALGLAEQVGTLAHHVLHVALRHSARGEALVARLGPGGADAGLFALAADGIVNETLQLAGHPLPRPAVLLSEVLAVAGLPCPSAAAALGTWDAERLALALASAGGEGAAERVRIWARARGFAPDLDPDRGGGPAEGEETPTPEDWHRHTLRAMEAGRRAGAGIGRLGSFLADLAPPRTPWEVVLRRLLATALAERAQPTWRRPSGGWTARAGLAAERGEEAPAFEPGRTRRALRPRLAIGLDTSSSVDAVSLALLAAEAEGVARRTGAEAHLLAFDTEVFARHRLDPHGWGRLRTAPDPLRRGGGTDYADLIAEAGRLAPALLVVLTDLEAPLPAAAPRGLPVLWAVPRAVDPPAWGRVLVVGMGAGG